ncbi:MAG: hypothetical protein AAGG08_11125, partial [Actinomycetota bacterium]
FFPWFIGTATTESLLRSADVPRHVASLADALDEAGDGRVLVIPGSDFAYPRVGGTIDPILPGVLDRPILSRELVPQGSQPTADLLNAHERRLHDGWSEPEAWPTIARLVDATAVTALNDHQYERFRLVRPGHLWPDLVATFGAPDIVGDEVRDETEIDLVDGITFADPARVDQFPVVAAWTTLDGVDDALGDGVDDALGDGVDDALGDGVDDALGGAAGTGDWAPVTVRRAGATMVLDGSGDGLVDLAGAGLLDPDLVDATTIRYRASLDDDQLADLVGTDDAGGTWWVVTDTNRRQGRRWSTIGSNLGPIESVAGRIDLDEDQNDQRLDLFESDPESTDPLATDRQTVAEHRGEVELVRSSYTGSRIAYTPEDAPFMATDGDLATAWRTAVFDDARGLELRIDLREPTPIDHVVVIQPTTGVVDRFITRARIHLDGAGATRSVDVDLDERSRTLDGQRVDLSEALTDGRAVETVRFEILADNLGPLASYAGRPGVGLAELRLPGVQDDRVVRLPVADEVPDGDRLTVVMTRERIDAATQNRFAPEPRLVRVVELPRDVDARLDVEIRLSADAADALIADTAGISPTPLADRRLVGAATTWAGAAIDGDPMTAWTTPIDGAIGSTLTLPLDGAEPAEIELRFEDDELHSIPTALTLTDGTTSTRVDAASGLDLGDGRVRLDWPAALRSDAGILAITIDDVAERTAAEYFSGLPQQLPVAVSEAVVIGVDGGRRVAADVEAGRDLADLGCRDDLLQIDGEPVPLRLQGEVGDLLLGHEIRATTCQGEPIRLASGEHRIETKRGAATGLDVDRLVLDDPGGDDPGGDDAGGDDRGGDDPGGDTNLAVGRTAIIESTIDRRSATELAVDIGPRTGDSWLVLEESWNLGWTATLNGVDLGDPQLVDGYANGWIVPPGDAVRVELTWEPQRLVRLGLAVSALAGALVLGLLLATSVTQRRRDVETSADPDNDADSDTDTNPDTDINPHTNSRTR